MHLGFTFLSGVCRSFASANPLQAFEHCARNRFQLGLVVGYAAEEILKTAVKENCDLIVMGTHGRKGIDRILFGSVAEKVVKRSSVPVLTIRPHAVSGTEGK